MKQLQQTQRRKHDTIERAIKKHNTIKAKTPPISKGKLRVIPLGGQNGIGEKNMIVVEYQNDAIVLDCGFSLGLDLPGVNYAVPAIDYLETIKHKLRGYVISHAHMDHTGGLMHTVPSCPAPIYGSQFTIGGVQLLFEKAAEDGLLFTPECHALNMDTHETIQLGVFTIELVRVTHSVPESSAIVVKTPLGVLINTGDFRLDPEPLDTKLSDIARLKQLGNEGVLLLMSESTNTTRPGRTPTEHTLQGSFAELITKAKGRVFVAVFSTNMNRIQMIIEAAARQGRKVALDGRSMVSMAELAVRLGNLKIPKGTLVAMRETASVPDNKLVVICTGGQGEPGAAMSRMAAGEHQYLKLKQADTVIVSSTPIPGNERSYQEIADSLSLIGVKQYRHNTHQIDSCGPLHVSGHAARDEHAEMIALTRPKYLMPIYGGALNRGYHRGIGLENGIAKSAIIMANNGDVVELDSACVQVAGRVSAGARLISQTNSLTSGLVIKDRLLLKNDGFIVVTAVFSKKAGRLVASPDIITRGTVAIRDNSQLIDELRLLVKKQALPRYRSSLDLAKAQLKEAIEEHVFKACGLTPIVIPVITAAP